MTAKVPWNYLGFDPEPDEYEFIAATRQRKQIKSSEVNRETVIKIWRKEGGRGRLRWRDCNGANYGWSRGDIAMTKVGTLRTFYATYDAILDDCGYDVID